MISSFSSFKNGEDFVSACARAVRDAYRTGELSSNVMLSQLDEVEKLRKIMAYKVTKGKIRDVNSNHKNFFHDSGSNAHLSNDKSVFLPGSVKKCHVYIGGIHDDGSVKPMHAELCGDVVYNISDDVSVVLHDVLYVPDSSLSDENRVLVSTMKFVRECGVGLHFLAGGEFVEFTLDDESLSRVRVNGDYFIHTVQKERKIQT